MEKEYLDYLEERNERLVKLERMICSLQMNANDRPEEVRLNHEDLKQGEYRLLTNEEVLKLENLTK